MKEMFKSAIHIIIMDNNKILLQKRKGSKLWPGYYALPAGHIDKGENQYEALIREAKEELGLDITDDDMMVATLVATIAYRNETHENVRVVSVKQIG